MLQHTLHRSHNTSYFPYASTYLKLMQNFYSPKMRLDYNVCRKKCFIEKNDRIKRNSPSQTQQINGFQSSIICFKIMRVALAIALKISVSHFVLHKVLYQSISKFSVEGLNITYTNLANYSASTWTLNPLHFSLRTT